MINSENEWLWAGRVENVGFVAAAGKEMENRKSGKTDYK